jgi:bifunctional non-homologous end joining protein LigD
LVKEAPAGDRWLHEIKWDGYRLMARLEAGKVTLRTRNGYDWTHRFPSITEAVAALPVPGAHIDGEAVVETRGVPDLAALEEALMRGAAQDAMLWSF